MMTKIAQDVSKDDALKWIWISFFVGLAFSSFAIVEVDGGDRVCVCFFLLLIVAFISIVITSCHVKNIDNEIYESQAWWMEFKCLPGCTVISSYLIYMYGGYGISGIQSTTDYQHCRQFASGEIGCHHSAHKYSKWNAFDFCLLRHLSLSLGVVVFFLSGICGRRLHFKWL